MHNSIVQEEKQGIAERIQALFRDVREIAEAFGGLLAAEKLMYLAVICFGAVGANGTYQFYEPSRGPIFAAMASIGIEAMYIGAASVAVLDPNAIRLVKIMLGIGGGASAIFGTASSMIGYTPGLFGFTDGVQTSAIVWPTWDQWIIFGGLSLIEGIVPAMACVLLSLFLHDNVSDRRRKDEEKIAAEERKLELQAQGGAIVACPFCNNYSGTSAQLHGHSGHCAAYKEDARTKQEKQAIINRAIQEATARG